MCEIFLGWNVFVCLYTFRSKNQISIGNCRCKCGSCQRLKLSRRIRVRLLFHPVCLIPWVLQMAWYQYKQDISAQSCFSTDWMIYKENYYDGSFVFLSGITE